MSVRPHQEEKHKDCAFGHCAGCRYHLIMIINTRLFLFHIVGSYMIINIIYQETGVIKAHEGEGNKEGITEHVSVY